MQLEIKLFAGLECNNPDLPYYKMTEFQFEAADGMTVGELRELLAIDPTIRLLCMVNHHNKPHEWVLNDKDRVAIFPPIGGG